jgi:hypothetical protein
MMIVREIVKKYLKYTVDIYHVTFSMAYMLYIYIFSTLSNVTYFIVLNIRNEDQLNYKKRKFVTVKILIK